MAPIPAPVAEMDIDNEPERAENPLLDMVDKTVGQLRVRLAGAPEWGDPHYRMYADGRQIFSGNIDWAEGRPKTVEGAVASRLCAQDIAIDWTMNDVIPREISFTFDADSSGIDNSPTLLYVEWIELLGVRISSSGPHAHVEGERIPWPGGELAWSWSGELKFDVAATLLEMPDDAPKGADGPPKVYSADVLDVEIIEEMGMPALLNVAGSQMDEHSASIDLNGEENARGDRSLQSPSKERFRDDLGEETLQQSFTQDPLDQTWKEMPTDPVPSSADEQMMDRAEMSTLSVQSEPIAVTRGAARQQVDHFYAQVLKRALSRLHDSAATAGADKGTPINNGATDEFILHRNMRSRGEQIRTRFFESILLSANARLKEV